VNEVKKGDRLRGGLPRDVSMKELIRELRISLLATFLLAVILCGMYPVVVWVLAQGLFPARANGKTFGSSLIGQGFAGPSYFHPRPSAAGEGYDAAHSGGTNWGPLSKKLTETVQRRVAAYRGENSLPPGTPVPADAVTASASGLDPHISVKNALLQARRVAQARGMSVEVVLKKIQAHTENRSLWIFGEPRVNVLMLNLDLDGRL
jgi:K+-transporting ATPase ATPase C chain